MSVLNAFTTQLSNLSQNLCKMFPNDSSLQLTNMSISLLKKNNPRQLNDLFNRYIPKYKAQILNKDSNFFIERNTEDYLDENNEVENIENIENIILNLKKYWNSMDNESQENIWKYLQVLIVLNDQLNP
uniref:Uncharacterized protein n=1 Tax=viral metagenome TaxID=1070528 RepID=A0A6C0IYD0_9ZZZZ